MSTVVNTAERIELAFADGVQWSDVPEVLRALADCAEKSVLIQALLALCINAAAGKAPSIWDTVSSLLPAALSEIRN